MPGNARGPLFVFAIALAVRLVHVWQLRTAPFFDLLLGDARSYDVWARQIAAGNWVGHEVFYQAPLYPYFLGVIYTVGGRSLLLVRIVQAIVGASSCALLADAGRRLFSNPVGIAAGLILALYAPAIFFDALIQKSVLDVFFVCCVIWLISRIENQSAIRNPQSAIPRLIALGTALGALALTRENALVFILVLAAWAFRTVSARAALMIVAGVAIVLLPVAIRNALMPDGGFFVTTAQFGPNFYIGNHPGADGTYESLRYGRGAPEYERQDATDLAEHALARKLTPAEVSSYWTDRALDFITSTPGAWLTLTARKAALLVNATEMVDTEDQATHAEWSLPLRILSPVGHFGVLLPLAVLGAFATWRDRRKLTVLYALGLAYAASVVAFYVFARYRYPLVPFLTLFAAAGIVGLGRWRAERARPLPFVIAGALAAVAANWPIVDAHEMRAVTESNLGVALQGEHRLDDAVAHYRKAIAIAPDYAPAFSNLATALRDQNRIDEARQTYERALQLKPDFAGAHYNLANLLLDRGEPAAAADHFQRALKTEPASADVHNNLGIALAATGRVDDAAAEFRAAFALDSTSAKALRNLGDALSTKGDADGAIDALRHAAGLAPADAAIRYDLAGALLENGRLDEAIAEFREAIRIAPRFAEAHNNLGIALGSQGKLDEAIAEFERALAVSPGFADAQKNLATAQDAKRRQRSR